MVFWIIIVALSALVVLMLARGMLRPGDAAVADASEFDLKVYRDQLAEVERDVARGVIGAEDAERARTEISRRILAADANRSSQDAAANNGSTRVERVSRCRY